MTKYAQCMDCNQYPDDYMVHDHVWGAVTESRKGFLCLSCLDKRLKKVRNGKGLCIDDIPDRPCNRPIFYGALIAMREAFAKMQVLPAQEYSGIQEEEDEGK